MITDRPVVFVITAGGTVEPIDDVRSITNHSTGSLGVAIYNALVSYLKITKLDHYMIYYIKTSTAQLPQVENRDNHTQIIEATDIDSVGKAIRGLLEQVVCDYFIQAMAISDFGVDYVVSQTDMVNQLTDKIRKFSYQTTTEAEFEQGLAKIIQKTLATPAGLARRNKLSSGQPLLLGLKSTPKLIGLIKQKSPHTVLVGFKLLSQATDQQLIEAANQLALRHHCDYVLANDLTSLKQGQHRGLLIQQGQILAEWVGKQQIATGLVRMLLETDSRFEKKQEISRNRRK